MMLNRNCCRMLQMIGERCKGATEGLESKERQQLVMVTSRRYADYIADGPAGRKLSGASAYVEF